MTQHRIAYITAPVEVAEQIAITLVEEDLVRCVNIVEQVKSIYKWEGQVERAMESLLLVKVMADRTDELIDKVREIHPYEVPEILFADIVAGNEDYLEWLAGKEIEVDDVDLDEDIDLDDIDEDLEGDEEEGGEEEEEEKDE
jgi:periplasmic divalent cation tolerance protein